MKNNINLRMFGDRNVIDITSSDKMTYLTVYLRKGDRDLVDTGKFIVQGNIHEAIFVATNIMLENKNYNAIIRE